jgi:hypothetical protein
MATEIFAGKGMPPLCTRCGNGPARFQGYPSPDELQAAARPEDTGHRRDEAGNLSYWIRVRPEQIELLCDACRTTFESEAAGRHARPFAPEAQGE